MDKDTLISKKVAEIRLAQSKVSRLTNELEMILNPITPKRITKSQQRILKLQKT